MSATAEEHGLKGVLKELLSYKSGIFGLTVLVLLIFFSLYTVFTVPYSKAIRLWRGEKGIWLENPRNAQPSWVNLLGNKLPNTITLDSSQTSSGVVKSLTSIPNTNISLLKIQFSFDYYFDAFPSEVNIFLESKYSESAPLLKIYWLKPDYDRIKLLEYLVKSPDDKLYFSINPKVSETLNAHVVEVLNRQPEVVLPIEQSLFATEDESISSTLTATPLKGKYRMVIDATLFGDSNVDAKLIVYGKVHGWAGTDHLRRDLSIALMWGVPIALSFGITASLTITILQLIIAAISGFYGGRIDSLIQRLTETYMIIPFLPFIIMVASLFRLNIWVLLAVIIILSVFGGGIKSTRALVMQIKEYPYIEAAESYGASSLRIIFLYIIPKILPPIVPSLIGSIPGYVFLEAALSFLGLGDPYLPSWGKVINDSFSEGALYKGYFYWVLEPALLLILTTFAFSFLGFALDRIVNPKLKEV